MFSSDKMLHIISVQIHRPGYNDVEYFTINGEMTECYISLLNYLIDNGYEKHLHLFYSDSANDTSRQTTRLKNGRTINVLTRNKKKIEILKEVFHKCNIPLENVSFIVKQKYRTRSDNQINHASHNDIIPNKAQDNIFEMTNHTSYADNQYYEQVSYLLDSDDIIPNKIQDNAFEIIKQAIFKKLYRIYNNITHQAKNKVANIFINYWAKTFEGEENRTYWATKCKYDSQDIKRSDILLHKYTLQRQPWFGKVHITNLISSYKHYLAVLTPHQLEVFIKDLLEEAISMRKEKNSYIDNIHEPHYESQNNTLSPENDCMTTVYIHQVPSLLPKPITGIPTNCYIMKLSESAYNFSGTRDYWLRFKSVRISLPNHEPCEYQTINRDMSECYINLLNYLVKCGYGHQIYGSTFNNNINSFSQSQQKQLYRLKNGLLVTTCISNAEKIKTLQKIFRRCHLSPSHVEFVIYR